MSDKINYLPLITSIAMIAMGSALTALLKPQPSIGATIRNLLAGIVAGMIIAVFCWNNEIKSKWADMAQIMAATFITHIYPVLEKWVSKYVHNKVKDIP